MKNNYKWLDRLNRDKKGIWGVVNQEGSERGGQCVIQSTSDEIQLESIYVFIDDDKALFKNSQGILSELDFTEICTDALKSANEFERSSIRIVIQDFQFATDEEKGQLIKSARSIQESESSVSFQFVFCGSWSYFSFFNSYLHLHGKTSSPAAEQKNILYVPELTSKDIIKALADKVMIAQPIEIDLIAANLVIERTSGNEYLVNTVIEYLADKDGYWVDNIEIVLDELTHSPDVIKNISTKFDKLDSSSKKEIVKLLRIHRLSRNKDSVSSDQLWLSGLISRHNIKQNKQLLKVSGLITNSILRKIPANLGAENCASADDLCIEGTTISSFAYNKVAEIENLLRSLVVSQWYLEKSENWKENLKAIRTTAFEVNEKEELINLVIKCMQEKFPAINSGSNSVNTAIECVPDKKNKPIIQESLYDSTLDWQNRQERHHGFELGNNNLMHFMTTENLEKVLLSKKVGIAGIKGIPGVFDRNFLITTLDEYKVIRSAVAHNQPITLSTISRLDDLLRKLTDLLTNFIDRTFDAE